MATNAAVLAELDKSKKGLSRYKAKARESGERVVNAVAVVGGGALAGFLDGKYADKKLMGMSLPTVVGLAASAIGIMGAAGNYSDPVGNLGYGMIGIEAYKYALKKSSGSGSVSGYGGLYAA